jgi:hypothetical protein
MPKSEFRKVNSANRTKDQQYRFQVSRYMNVGELKALILNYIIDKVDDKNLPFRFDESHIGLFLLKPDNSFEDVIEIAKKSYKTEFSFVDRIDIPARQLRDPNISLSTCDLTLDSSVFVIEIKVYQEFLLRGDEDEEEEKMLTEGKTTKDRIQRVLPFPEKSQQSMGGITGLKNIGNTCFMNAALQCLSHTEDLTQYFLDKRYTTEINTDNPLGTGGKLAEAYASLIFELWNGVKSMVHPNFLRYEMTKYNNAVRFDDLVRQLQPARQPGAPIFAP